MNWTDIGIAALILLILGLAIFAIYRSSKSGKKCIGCPDSANCSKYGVGGCGCHTDKSQ